jgi:GNAT superfamily N-acetyltransferase
MNIREAEIEDINAIVVFQILMAWETEAVRLDIDTVEEGVKAVFADESKGKYYVVEMDGEVVASLLITYEWSDWRNSQVWWIQSVFVIKEYRKQGVFRALYKHVKSIAKNKPNIAGIRLYVDNSNKRAQEVYSKIGMNGEHYKVFEWMK